MMVMTLVFIVVLVLCIRIITEKYFCHKYHICFDWKHFWHLPQAYEQITTKGRGTRSELNLINNLLKSGYKETAVYHDLYVSKKNGTTSQIDVVLCTKIGLIVIEVKDYSGWIFGNGHQMNWVQITKYGRNKNYFYSPIKQNANHIKALKQCNTLKDIPMYSFIVFYGNCKLKNISQIPINTYIQHEEYCIKELNNIINDNAEYQYLNKWKIVEELQNFIKAGNNPEIRHCHAEQIRKTYL